MLRSHKNHWNGVKLTAELNVKVIIIPFLKKRVEGTVEYVTCLLLIFEPTKTKMAV